MIVRGVNKGGINIVFDGNSIFFGNSVTIAQRCSELIFNDASLVGSLGSVKGNISVGGQTTTAMISRQSSFLYPLYEKRATRNLLIVMEVRNDVYSGVTDANGYANMVTYCQNARNNGFDVILVGQTPSTGGSDPTGGSPVNRTQAELETSRLAIRTMFLADFNVSTTATQAYKPRSGITYANLYLDLGDPSTTMGNVAGCANATYYADGTHWTATGHSTEAALIKSAILYYYSITS